MKPVNEKEFEIGKAQIAKMHSGPTILVKKYLTALKPLFQKRNDPSRLTARLRRDAGIDELDLERKKLARAPLIR